LLQRELKVHLPAPNREEVELELRDLADEVPELAPTSYSRVLRTWYHIDALQELCPTKLQAAVVDHAV